MKQRTGKRRGDRTSANAYAARAVALGGLLAASFAALLGKAREYARRFGALLVELLGKAGEYARRFGALLADLFDRAREYAVEEPIGQRLRRAHSHAKKTVHEAHARNFPESGNVAMQLLLFLFGMLPYWGALAREQLHRLRGLHIRRTGGRRAVKWRAEKYHPLIFVGGALVIAAAAMLLTRYTIGTTVIYDGKALDTVASVRDAKRVAASLESITSETLGKSFSFSDSSIQYSSRIVARSELSEQETLEESLSDEVGLVTKGYSLYINDELVGSTEYAGALEGLLDQLKESYISQDTLTVDFVENVRIAEGYVPTESIVNLGHIAELLNSTKAGEVTYTVVKGDTWSGIANGHGMSSKELLALNPGFDINRLQIGDELTLSNAVPYLTVVVTERQNYVEDVQYDITYVDDASMYKGDYRVLSKGVYGSADVVADVIYINGEETERSIISSVTLSEPVTERRAQGTKERPSWYPTGSFRWPTSGRITSYFGYRNTGIRGASTNHKGIDIAVPYGTTIYAADGGKVIYSGYKGAMGNVVIIDHQNGFKTYYEHNSSLLVSVGQTVYKGQAVARAGRSGVASGVHCHFGIQYNGSYVNPLRYLS